MQYGHKYGHRRNAWRAAVVVLIWLVCGSASAADDDDVALGSALPAGAAYRPLSPDELEDLVAPVALYPDDLLAVVLPAATFPLQVVEADRYLQAADGDPTASPDPAWDQSVVALLNYPEVVDKLSGDLEWTRNLGEAVVNQQEAVLAAVERFRREAHTVGNLRSDERLRVDAGPDAVTIRSADPAVIYVPNYEPAQVIVWHGYPAFGYYPRPCPVYYYPYLADDDLMPRLSHPFWGVTSVYSIGWTSHHLQFHTLGEPGHPYFGHHYAFDHYRYWRPRLMFRSRPYDHGRWRRVHESLKRGGGTGAGRPPDHVRTWTTGPRSGARPSPRPEVRMEWMRQQEQAIPPATSGVPTPHGARPRLQPSRPGRSEQRQRPAAAPGTRVPSGTGVPAAIPGTAAEESASAAAAASARAEAWQRGPRAIERGGRGQPR